MRRWVHRVVLGTDTHSQPHSRLRRVLSKRRIAVAACVLLFGLIPAVAHAQTPSITKMWPRQGPGGRGVFINRSGFTHNTDVEVKRQPAEVPDHFDHRI